MKADAEIRLKDIMPDIDRAVDKAVFITSEQALKDCNLYCKRDSGALIDSSAVHSDTEAGILMWVTPYADKQYKHPGVRYDKNPLASPEWCEKAYENHGDQWRKIFTNALRKG